MYFSVDSTVGTQTLMTFPMNFDLLALLGPGFSYSEDKSACDLGNASLRRKLFGQPDRLVCDQIFFCIQGSPQADSGWAWFGGGVYDHIN